MTCPSPRSLLEDYVDGELPPAEADQVARHLTTCKDCRTEYEATLKLKNLLTRRSVPDPHPSYWNEVSSLILARTVESAPFEADDQSRGRVLSRERASFVRSLVAVAASLGIFIAAISFGSLNGGLKTETPTIDQRMLSTTSMVTTAHADARLGITAARHERVSQAMLLLGPPGLLGRFPEMAAALGLE